MNMISIQYQDKSGNWITNQIVQNISTDIIRNMRSLSNRYPNYRIRAVDKNGSVVDIL